MGKTPDELIEERRISKKTPPKPIRDGGKMGKQLTTRELAEQIGVSTVTVYKWIRDRKIPFDRRGPRETFFDLAAVQAALAKETDAPRIKAAIPDCFQENEAEETAGEIEAARIIAESARQIAARDPKGAIKRLFVALKLLGVDV